MRIAIIGGGNIGTQFAVHCVAKRHKTYLLTSKPQLISNKIQILDETGKCTLTGDGITATNSYEDACSNADVIFVTHPAPFMDKVAELMFPYIRQGTMIGLIPGTGGGECPFKKYVDKGCVVFGLQRAPSVSRLVEYGKKVRCVGYRDRLYLSAIPRIKSESCCAVVSDIFDIPCCPLPNYLNVTLTPSNPILHTTRLYSIFREYREGTGYDSLPLFYQEWSDETSELLFECDEEVQKICKALSMFDLSYVKSLKVHYGSETPGKLTEKIRNIKGFKGIATPSVCIDNKFYPDLTSRYFTADFAFGLEIIVQIASFVGVAVPNCAKVLNWYYNIAGKKNCFSYSKWEIRNYKEFEDFYLK